MLRPLIRPLARPLAREMRPGQARNRHQLHRRGGRVRHHHSAHDLHLHRHARPEPGLGQAVRLGADPAAHRVRVQKFGRGLRATRGVGYPGDRRSRPRVSAQGRLDHARGIKAHKALRGKSPTPDRAVIHMKAEIFGEHGLDWPNGQGSLGYSASMERIAAFLYPCEDTSILSCSVLI